MDFQTVVLPFLALVISGFGWTMAGYLKEWRNKHTDPSWTGFDKKALRDDLSLGAVLGIGTVIYVIYTNGTFTPINTVQEFFLAIGAGTGLVGIVDKYIVGFIFNR